jgi:hypothetical protein
MLNAIWTELEAARVNFLKLAVCPFGHVTSALQRVHVHAVRPSWHSRDEREDWPGCDSHYFPCAGVLQLIAPVRRSAV